MWHSFSVLLSRTLSPNAFYVLIIALVVFLSWFIITQVWFTIPQDQIPNFLIVVSAIAIVIGVLFTAAVKLHSEMRDQALKLLLTNRSDLIYQAAQSCLKEFFSLNKTFERDDILKLYRSRSPDCIRIRDSIGDIGNFFEEMAIAIKYNEVNEAILEEFYSGIFIRYYEKIKEFLPVIRNEVETDPRLYGEVDRSDVYCELDALYKKWKPRYERRIKYLKKNSESSESKRMIFAIAGSAGLGLFIVSGTILLSGPEKQVSSAWLYLAVFAGAATAVMFFRFARHKP